MGILAGDIDINIEEEAETFGYEKAVDVEAVDVEPQIGFLEKIKIFWIEVLHIGAVYDAWDSFKTILGSFWEVVTFRFIPDLPSYLGWINIFVGLPFWFITSFIIYDETRKWIRGGG